MPCSPTNVRYGRRWARPGSRALVGVLLLQGIVGCQSGSGASGSPGTTSTSRASTEVGSPVMSQGLRISGSTSQASLEAFAAQAATARIWVQRTWPRQVAATRTISVAIAGTDAQFSQLRGGGPLTDDVAASTTSQGRVIVSQQAMSTLTDQGRRVVLAHELTHVVLRQTQRAEVPLWIIEGSAEYTAYRWAGLGLAAASPTLRDQVRAGQLPSLPPVDTAFQGSTGQVAYQQAHAYMSFLVARFGLLAWKRFVVAASSGAQSAFGDTFGGSTPADLQRAYRVYLRGALQGSSSRPQ